MVFLEDAEPASDATVHLQKCQVLNVIMAPPFLDPLWFVTP